MLQYLFFLSFSANFDTHDAQARRPSSNFQKKTPQNLLGPTRANTVLYCYYIRSSQESNLGFAG